MSTYRSPRLGTGRITLVLLALAAAATAYPWESGRERWVLGVAIALAAASVARWRGLHLTTLVRRWAALKLPRGGERGAHRPDTNERVTVLLAVTAPKSEPDLLPLPLIARYLDRYGLRAEAIRVTSRDVVDESGNRTRTTWIGLTLSAVENLGALAARSPEIPLHRTAVVVARRLADSLRESGWAVNLVGPEEIPDLDDGHSRETWQAVGGDGGDYLAAYGVTPGHDVPELLAKVWSHPAPETWTVLEIAGSGDDQTLALGAALRTAGQPTGVPVPGLSPQPGNQRASLAALHPSSGQHLDGHVAVPHDVLTRVQWPSSIAGRAPAQSVAG
ncbi:type VII secretion protein EccE [Mycolicibacter minnesotensis]|uniref:Type VII secretion protein EccE n=1 Tax=Mycolicibacter minnesotensis TaxID=1118379 RepID=A0A7I7R085_9MYCO|nr:type VII secretion protein EccE [Mycolicibacter minnesotensis]ORB01710.1 type VII secretion protein EccE [Mycolicibacter minnesotensis]BBY32018.1 ESX-3 secretion system protein EccE3 [Mycolicibacter minnesotensis]